MQIQNNAKTLADAIDEARMRLAAKGPVSPADVACSVMQGLALEDPDRWAAIRDALILEFLTSASHRRMTRAVGAVDPRQGLLAFPEYSRVPQLIEVEGGFVDLNEATLEQYRESTAALSARIRSYAYPRRSDAMLKRDREQLAQRRRLDKGVTPLMAGAPEMKMGPAIQMHLASLETPKAKRNRKGGKARQRSNANSTT